MSIEPTGPGGVNAQFGPQTDDSNLVGVKKKFGGELVLTVGLTPETLASGLLGDVIVPAGYLPKEAVVTIDEAFAITGGASNEVQIGTSGSEATNGFDVVEATLEAVATTSSTSFNGTWAASLAADTTVGLAFAGGGTVAAGSGRGRVDITCVKA